MAKVVLPLDAARAFAGGVTDHVIDCGDVRALLRALDARFPGLRARLTTATAIAIDGEIYQDPWLEPIGTNSEVYFLPAIEGG